MAQKNVIPFRKNRKVANDRPGINDSRSTPRRHGHDRGRGFPTAIVWAVVIGAAGWLYLDRNGHLDIAAAFVKAPAQDSQSASFVICGDSHRTNCVVDGDTFWFEGKKIRIADIDTPELSPPRCEAERIKGEAAKSRLLTLLNAGKFSLSAGFRDEDKYGRKLRTVSRAGNSLGDVLIKEGLARPWDGARHGWCQGK
ncbi:thermonuclease family protein [Agrobacterium tumefaciens]|uniref:Nuclease n=3 Tax=Rhizobium/Agrobacterium group TaxID=227290 RepID=A0A2Z2PGQ9_RHIRH|nr:MULTISPECIES: thermonuclease family protein [Agrobacterium]ASK42127.1 nuclease [Rhizobium rhizogenes]WHO11946.1 thermonuclease family protein [Agrobacterium cucumeris]AXO68563.1 thermonuclease family protein [Rhizobium rhizogenes]NSX94245.1 thermonuclease family protein [Agrobacterium tumefaciens]NSZ82455.1 thermonuclease family protein [Agrobacterium tumefaciens]